MSGVCWLQVFGDPVAVDPGMCGSRDLWTEGSQARGPRAFAVQRLSGSLTLEGLGAEGPGAQESLSSKARGWWSWGPKGFGHLT